MIENSTNFGCQCFVKEVCGLLTNIKGLERHLYGFANRLPDDIDYVHLICQIIILCSTNIFVIENLYSVPCLSTNTSSSFQRWVC